MKAKIIISLAASNKNIERLLDGQQEMQVGRSPACPIHISDPKLSRIHCAFYTQDGSFYVKDMNSSNGTSVNQKRIQNPTPLKDGDIIRIGDSQIRFISKDITTAAIQAQSAKYQSNKLKKIDEYEYLQNLGGGGIGQVYLVQKKGVQFALKMLNPEAAADPTMVQRFFKEARACSILEHPNIIKLYDVGMFGERPYLVLEYAPGQALSDYIFKRKNLDPVTALKIAEPVVDALQYAHEKDIVHRDIKPSNILVTDDLKVKLIDMGMVKILNESGITLSGQTLGTPRYMPPEQIEDSSKITKLVDLYSLGATIYSMLAGTPPYHEVRVIHLSELLQTIISRPPRPLKEIVPEVPDIVINFVEKSMARQVKDRFQNAGVMKKEIKKVLEKLVK